MYGIAIRGFSLSLLLGKQWEKCLWAKDRFAVGSFWCNKLITRLLLMAFLTSPNFTPILIIYISDRAGLMFSPIHIRFPSLHLFIAWPTCIIIMVSWWGKRIILVDRHMAWTYIVCDRLGNTMWNVISWAENAKVLSHILRKTRFLVQMVQKVTEFEFFKI